MNYTFLYSRKIALISIIGVIIFFFPPLRGYTQNSTTLSEAAISQLNYELKAGKFGIKIEEANIKGTYMFDITIHKKGEVVTVFALSDENTNIDLQNKLKELIKKQKFDLEIPKDMRVKFNYTFHLY